MPRFLPALIAALGLTACINARVTLPYQPDQARVPEPVSTSADIGFDYPRSRIAVRNTVLDHLETDHYRLRHLKFASSGENGQPDKRVDVWFYHSKQRGNKRLIIVLPIWGSYVYPPWQMTQGLASHYKGDAHVAYFLGENYLLDWDGMAAVRDIDEFDRAMRGAVERFRTMVIDIRRFIDWATEEPGVDARRIGLIGFSISAIVGSLAAASDQRIHATALIMGGANPHELMAACDGRPKMVRQSVLARLNWNTERYRSELERVFAPVNVARFAGRVHPARVLLVDAAHDTCAPKTARDALWEAMGRPKRVSLLYDHKPAFLSMTPLGSNWLRGEVYRFFDHAL